MSEEKEWCQCGEYPADMCSQWPACVDINGNIWGALPQFQKFRRRNQDGVQANERRDSDKGGDRRKP